MIIALFFLISVILLMMKNFRTWKIKRRIKNLFVNTCFSLYTYNKSDHGKKMSSKRSAYFLIIMLLVLNNTIILLPFKNIMFLNVAIEICSNIIGMVDFQNRKSVCLALAIRFFKLAKIFILVHSYLFEYRSLVYVTIEILILVFSFLITKVKWFLGCDKILKNDCFVRHINWSIIGTKDKVTSSIDSIWRFYWWN